MTTESDSPYSPPTDVDSETSGTETSRRFAGSLVSAGCCVLAGFTFVVTMSLVDFHVGTVILFIATLSLLALALASFFLRLRIIAPMFTLIPFLVVVAKRHVGDMEQMHYLDGIIYLLGCLGFIVALVSATIVKSILMAFRS